MRRTGIILFGILWLAAGAVRADGSFVNVNGGTVEAGGGVGAFVVTLRHPSTGFGATFTDENADHPSGEDRVTVRLSGWECLSRPLRDSDIADAMSSVLGQVEAEVAVAANEETLAELTEALGDFDRLVPAPLLLLIAETPGLLLSGEDLEAAWPSGQDFSRTFDNCYADDDLVRLDGQVKDAIRDRLTAIRDGLARVLEDDPTELGDQEAIQ
jgi:hypothetical protein